jgi:hypothetical protein
MPSPTYRSSRTLDIVKGLRLEDGRMDIALALPDAATLSDYIPGKVGRRDTDGTLLLGCSAAKRHFFTMAFAEHDGDITYDGGDPATERGSAVSIGPGGRAGMPCLVAGDYWELRSTAFVSSGSWAIDDYITSDDGDGRLKRVTGAWDSVTTIGQVSRLFTDNQDGFTGLTFWSMHSPAAVTGI